MNPTPKNIDTLYQDIRQLIEAARSHVVTQVNQALLLTYWQIGKAIKTDVLGDGGHSMAPGHSRNWQSA